MTPITKKLAVSCLALGAIATWAPQLLPYFQARPASEANSAQPAFVVSESEIVADAIGEPSLSPAGDLPQGESTRLEPRAGLLGDLQNILAERDANRRRQVLLQSPDHPVADPVPQAIAADGAPSAPSAFPPRASPLGRFLAENTLTALIGGGEDACAIFGESVLRVGDAFPGAEGILAAVNGKTATIRVGERCYSITLQQPTQQTQRPANAPGSANTTGQAAGAAPEGLLNAPASGVSYPQ